MQKNKQKNSDMLPSGGLFPSYGTELIPLLPYLRAGLSKKGGGGGGKVGIAPGNRPLLSDFGRIKGFLTSRSTQAWRKFC